MISILLALIFLSFISLGLPDAMLGAAWPIMYNELGVQLAFLGIVTTIISIGTIVSTFLSDKLTKKFGTQSIVIFSIFLTASSLFGFSSVTAFWQLCLLAIPYGFGAGSLDAALNNYVAIYYKSRQMNWLHCFWGVGAAIGPFIMGYNLTGGFGWSNAYLTVSIIQFSVIALVLISLPLWKKQRELSDKPKLYKPMKFKDIIKIRGIKYALLAFFCICAIETTTGIWAASFLVMQRGVDPEIAAGLAALVFIGLTVGRFLSGFVSDKLGTRTILRIGVVIMFLGIIALWIPSSRLIDSQTGLVLIGFGAAPLFPSLIHATSENFGKENAQAIIGVQMASAYTGITLAPIFFGFLADNVSIALLPIFLLLFVCAFLLITERLNRTVDKAKKSESIATEK